MDWTVTYRAQDGKVSNLVIEATDRAMLFKLLNERGITAIRVEQGRSKNLNASKSSNRFWIWVVLPVIVFVSIVTSIILLWGNGLDAKKAKVEKRDKIKSVEAPLSQNNGSAAKTNGNDEYCLPILTGNSNQDNEEMALPLPETRVRDENALVVSNAFHSGAEQVMAWIFSCELGSPPPPLPIVNIRNEQHLYDILFTKLEEAENDSERTKEAKRSVEEAKKELCEYIKQGGEVQDFLKYYREQLLQAHHEYCDARKLIMDAYKDGESREFAEELTAKINERLEAKGIKPVELPEAFIQHYAGDEEQ